MRTCLINPLTGRSVKTDSAIGRKLVGNKFADLLKTRNQLSALVMEADTKKKVGRPKKVKSNADVVAKPAPKKKVKSYADVVAKPAPKKRGRPKKVKSYADVVAKPPPRPRGRPKKVL